jgi:hypothetical protein
MAIITRAEKGSALSHTEMDGNFVELRDAPDGRLFPSTQGVGIRLDHTDPQWGWHDMLSAMVIDPNSANKPSFQPYIGGITEYSFSENDEILTRWHIPHDYAPGTDLFVHVHWSHDSGVLTGGDTTWSWEMTYAKGHDQAAFGATKVITVTQAPNITPYQHLIAETAMSVSGGSATQLDTSDIEVDGIVLCRFFLNSNDLTSSGGGLQPKPFVHFVDIHYQSTNLPTKNRAPSFWTE